MARPTRTSWAYIKSRAKRCGGLSLQEDAVIAAITAVLGWFFLDRESAIENAFAALVLGLGAGVIWQVGKFCWRFIWTVPRELDAEREEALERIAILETQQRERDTALVRADWEKLASQFKEIPHDVRADWSSGGFNWDGVTLERQWYIAAGDGSKDCESLCRRAGKMLMKSPHISMRLTNTAQSEQDDILRWLDFLKEYHNAVRITGQGTETAGGKKRSVTFGSIDDLGSVSARACIECSTDEI